MSEPASRPRSAADVRPREQEGVTHLLRSWAEGDFGAREQLFDVIYPELRRLARQSLLRESADLSLQATELAHEAYLRLIDQRRVDWRCRAQFFAVSATLIRRILVDHAKARGRHKRGSGAVHLSLHRVELGEPTRGAVLFGVDLLDLDRALVELAAVSQAASRIVELRYFAGLSVDETALALSLGRATVVRKWRFARAWMAQKLEAPAGG